MAPWFGVLEDFIAGLFCSANLPELFAGDPPVCPEAFLSIVRTLRCVRSPVDERKLRKFVIGPSSCLGSWLAVHLLSQWYTGAQPLHRPALAASTR